MAEESIGTARIDIIVNTDQFNTAVTRAKTLTSQLGESGEAAYQRLNRGAKSATTNLLKWAEGLGRTTEEQRLLNAAVRGVPIEALEKARKAIIGQREAAQAARQATIDQAEAQKAAARLQAEAAVEAERRTQQEVAARQKLVAQNLEAFRSEQAHQQRLAQMRADALHAFGPELAARERENAEIRRSNAVRERLTAFLATERGQRIQEAEAIRKQTTAYANMATVQSRAFGSTAKSAKELQFAMRGVPAQLTDIFTGLATGQRPLTLFLQQGGQLKDMFGGIGPAAKALGTSLLGLVNPLTIAAGAAAALFIAWKEGSDEAVAYNKALITTGNYAGLTADRLGLLADRISDTTDATQHAAAGALADVAASGKFTADQIELVGRAALAMSEMTGQATSETIRQFEDIGKKPVEAIAKLNDSQHFLTLAVYEQIKALEDQGKTQDAAALAMRAYSESLTQRSKEVVQNAGYMERAWHAVTSAAKGAWDAMLNVGREKSLGDQAQALQDQIKDLKAGRFLPNGTYQQGLSESAPEIQALRKQISDIYTQAEEQARKARVQAAQAQVVQNKVDADRAAASAKHSVFSDSIGNDPRADLTASIAKEIEGYKKEADAFARNTSAAAAYRRTLHDMLDTRQRAIDLQVQSIGMGQREVEQQQALIAIDQDYNRKKADLQRRQQNATSALDREGYKQQLDDLEAYHTQRIQMELAGFRRAEEARKNAALGARAAIADFQDASDDVAGQTYSVWTNSLQGMTDELANFFTTGKANWKDFAQDVLKQIAKIQIAKAVAGIASSVGGGYGGTNGQGGVQYNTQGFVSHVYAKGGIVDGSRNLSSYSGRIVDRPTLFAFAKGSGLMGEAGPEAIMPLRRGPDGKLGVAASGGSGDVQVEINVTNNSGQAVQPRQTGTRRDGQKVIVDMVLDAVANDIAGGGKTAKAMQQRFGVQRRGVPVGG